MKVDGTFEVGDRVHYADDRLPTPQYGTILEIVRSPIDGQPNYLVLWDNEHIEAPLVHHARWLELASEDIDPPLEIILSEG